MCWWIKLTPQKKAAWLFGGFFAAWSWLFAPLCTDVPPLCAPPQECPVSARQVKAGGSEGRPGGRNQTQTEHLEMLLLFFLSLSLSHLISAIFSVSLRLPPRLFHGRKLVYLWKEIKKRRKCLSFYAVFVLFSIRFTFFLHLICHEAIRSHLHCLSSSLSSLHPCSRVLRMLW